MVPAAYVWMPLLPITANGKLDRAALPAPGRERPPLARPYRAPRDAAETAVCTAFADVLELDRVGVVVERAEKRVVGADVGTDEHDGQSRRGLRRPPPELIASSPRACAKSHSGSPIRASLRMLAEREKAPAHGRGFLVSDYR